MIKVTRLNGKSLYVNCERIEFIESTPDTVITMVDEKKIIVTDGVESIVDKIVAFKARVVALPASNVIYRDEV